MFGINKIVDGVVCRTNKSLMSDTIPFAIDRYIIENKPDEVTVKHFLRFKQILINSSEKIGK